MKPKTAPKIEKAQIRAENIPLAPEIAEKLIQHAIQDIADNVQILTMLNEGKIKAVKHIIKTHTNVNEIIALKLLEVEIEELNFVLKYLHHFPRLDHNQVVMKALPHINRSDDFVLGEFERYGRKIKNLSVETAYAVLRVGILSGNLFSNLIPSFKDLPQDIANKHFLSLTGKLKPDVKVTGEILANFTGLTQEFAELLKQNGHVEAVLLSKESFVTLDLDETVRSQIKNGKSISKSLIKLIQSFPEATQAELATLFLDNEYPLHEIAKIIHLFPGIDKDKLETRIKKFILEFEKNTYLPADYTEHMANLIKNLAKEKQIELVDLLFEDDGWIAHIVKTVSGSIFAWYMRVNPNKLAKKLLEKTQNQKPVKYIGNDYVHWDNLLQRFLRNTANLSQESFDLIWARMKELKEKNSLELIIVIDNFRGLTMETYEMFMAEGNISYIAYAIEAFPVKPEVVYQKLMELGGQEEVIIECIEKLKPPVTDHGMIARGLIETGKTEVLLQHLSKLKKLPQTMAHELIEAGQTGHVLYALESFKISSYLDLAILFEKHGWVDGIKRCLKKCKKPAEKQTIEALYSLMNLVRPESLPKP